VVRGSHRGPLRRRKQIAAPPPPAPQLIEHRQRPSERDSHAQAVSSHRWMVATRDSRRDTSGTMRRITVVVGVCALAAAWTGVAAVGNAANHSQLAPVHLRIIHPLTLGRPQLPSAGGGCFVSSVGGTCSLTPCTAFVAASAGPDWIPISGPCHRSTGQITSSLPRLQRFPQLSKLFCALHVPKEACMASGTVTGTGAGFTG
jgi:hypothetical protein